jgi:uncharacterized protein YqcC (DUF446 family)
VIDRAAYAAIADRIELELITLGWWRDHVDDPGPPTGAFGGVYQSYTQWIQFTLLPKVRQIAEGGDPPAQSNAGTQAVREFDGFDAAGPLIDALIELDNLVNHGA